MHLEEAASSSMNRLEEGAGPCSSNYDDKTGCDSVADTCDENVSDEEKVLEENCQKIPVKCKVYSGDRTECQSSGIPLNSEDCGSNLAKAARSRSKIMSESDNNLVSVDIETHASESLSILSCNTSADNSQISSCNGGRNVEVVPSGTRRIFVPDTNSSNNEAKNLEMVVSSTVLSECEEPQDVKSSHLAMCNNGTITPSDEVSADSSRECKVEVSEVTDEEMSVPRQEVAISGNTESQMCTEKRADKVLEPKSSYIRIRTPGFGDDIIQSVDEVAVCAEFIQKLREHPQEGTCENEGMLQELRAESEVKSLTEVMSSDVTKDDETFHNGQHSVAAKQDDNGLCKDSDEQEDDDDEGFNEDIICAHGMLNYQLYDCLCSTLEDSECYGTIVPNTYV